MAGKTLADFDWLVAQFHETLNGDRKPNEVLAGSGEMIWWRCPEGPDHEWQAQVRSRTMRGAGCRFCAHKEVAPSDSLEVRFPAIAAQWHPTRNGEKGPATTWFAAKYAAWWQCSAYKTHAWRMRVSTRTSLRSSCTLCAGLKRPAAHKGALTIVQASA